MVWMKSPAFKPVTCATYVGASLQALYFGSVLDRTGDWTMVFKCIIIVLVVMALAAVAAGFDKKKGKER